MPVDQHRHGNGRDVLMMLCWEWRGQALTCSEVKVEKNMNVGWEYVLLCVCMYMCTKSAEITHGLRLLLLKCVWFMCTSKFVMSCVYVPPPSEKLCRLLGQFGSG